MPRILHRYGVCAVFLLVCLLMGACSSNDAEPEQEAAQANTEPYPQGVKETFMGSCTSSFMEAVLENPSYTRETAAPLASSYCECAFTCMERGMTFPDFEAYDQALQENREPEPSINAVAEGCMERCADEMIKNR